MANKNKTIAIISAILVQVIFGFSFLFTKMSTDIASPLILLSWRFATAFIFLNLLIVFKLVKINFKQLNIKNLLLLSSLYPLAYFVFETYGVQYTTASESSIIIALIPIATLVFTNITIKEKPKKIQIIGILLAFFGVVFVVLVKDVETSFSILGYFLLILSVISFAIYSPLAQKSNKSTQIEKTYFMLAIGTLFFTVFALLESYQKGNMLEYFKSPFINLNFLLSILYLGIIASVGAFLMINYSISVLGSNKTVSFNGICTIVAVSASIIFLKEEFNVLQIFGMLLILSGVYIANFVYKKNSNNLIVLELDKN